jgi:hypothetical protein
MTKRYQSGNQVGTNQRRTDNTMTKRYQRGNQEGTNQRRTDNTMTKNTKAVIKKAQIKEGLTIQ